MGGAFQLHSHHGVRRAYSRLRVEMPARLMTLDGWRMGAMLDLSQGGARLLLDTPGRFSGGVLHWLDYQAFGYPVWRAGRDIGLEFEEALPLDWVIATRGWNPSDADTRTIVRRAARGFVQGG